MANSRGPVFLSYRRNRLKEIEALVRALQDRGVPTWLDITNLANEPTEATIREVIKDGNTSGAILWLTPDVEDSQFIRAVEAPEAVGRHRDDDCFWLVIVLAKGLDCAGAGELFKDTLGGEDLSAWNLSEVSSPWATSTDIAQIAASALRMRIAAIYGSTESPASIEVSIHAQGTMVRAMDDALSLDWTGYFADGPPGADAWVAMSAAARDVTKVLKQEASQETGIRLRGTPSVPASILLGSTFSGRDGHIPIWMQREPDGFTITPWSMRAATDAAHAKERGWKVADPIYGDTAGNALAMCISVSDDVSSAFARSQDVASQWRAIIKINAPAGRNTRALPLTAQEAASLVHLTIDAIRDFRAKLFGIESIHFFVAAPAGFGVLLGTRLATLPAIATYEYETVTARYVRAATIIA